VDDVDYLEREYGSSSAIYRQDNLAVYFVYDSYHVPSSDWHSVLKIGGGGGTTTSAASVGGVNDDNAMSLGINHRKKGLFIGLWLDRNHGRELKEGGFDGFYTYFASMGFVYGSTPRHWSKMCEFARENEMISILSVGPGYNDDKIRPWNKHNNKPRGKNGEYYQEMFMSAIQALPSAMSITSYNEWGEGTQIEPAIKYTAAERGDSSNSVVAGSLNGGKYLDYGEAGPYLYVNLTKKYISLFREQIHRTSNHNKLIDEL
jgi:glycoprotein endo-alpha-1,2-mannosidase